MEEITPAKGGNEGWNSDDILTGDITLEQGSRLLSAYISALRILLNDSKNGKRACLKSAYRMIGFQIAMLDDESLTEGQREFAEKSINLGLIAVGQAMVAAASGSTDPRTISGLADSAYRAVEELVKIEGAEKFGSNHVIFKLRKEGEEIIIGAMFKTSGEVQESLVEPKPQRPAEKAKSRIIKIGGLKKSDNDKN